MVQNNFIHQIPKNNLIACRHIDDHLFSANEVLKCLIKDIRSIIIALLLQFKRLDYDFYIIKNRSIND